jgi:HPt (histidine-containing phosphotransfer) domain-containing protein
VPEPIDVTSLEALRKLQRPGRPDRVARIVSSFQGETDSRLVVLRRACAENDASALEQAAHALRGISGTVGAHQMYDLAVRLEQIGRAGHTVGAALLVTELELALARAWPVLDRLRDAV